MLTDEQFFDVIKTHCAKVQETDRPIVVVMRGADGTYNRQRMLDLNWIEGKLRKRLEVKDGK